MSYYIDSASLMPYQNTSFFKGPLLSIITEFSELITIPNLLNYNNYKNDLKNEYYMTLNGLPLFPII